MKFCNVVSCYVVFQVCRFVDEIVDSVYMRHDLILLLDHSVIDSSLPLLYDNPSLYCDRPMQSGASSDSATANRHSSQGTSCDKTDMPSRNVGRPSAMHLPRHLTSYSTTESGTDVTASRQQSRLQNSVGPVRYSPVNDFVSQLNIQLAPLSDFLAQHLAMLQTWLSCTSYKQLVALLCRHIAEVHCFD